MVLNLTKPDINDPEIVAEICSRLSAGETTRKITQEMRVERAFWVRMQHDNAFAATIARARQNGADALIAETIDIADEGSEEDVNHRKLKIWSRQWYASKLAPKKYGDKLEVSGNTTVTHEAGDSLTGLLDRVRGERGLSALPVGQVALPAGDAVEIGGVVAKAITRPENEG